MDQLINNDYGNDFASEEGQSVSPLIDFTQYSSDEFTSSSKEECPTGFTRKGSECIGLYFINFWNETFIRLFFRY